MITIHMHESESRLSALVKAVEEEGETVILQRNGQPVAEIHRYTPPPAELNRRDLTPDPRLRPILAPGYDPAEPLSDDEWPEDSRCF
jgi:antitoxin (DNA-binding transcriptional repressor) of toxin-antitoxin stability system